VKLSCRGRVTSGHNYPGIGVGTVSPTGVQVSVGNSAPDDHFGAGPHRGVKRSASSRVGVASGYPTIGRGIVSPAGVQIGGEPVSTPDYHLCARPHCRVKPEINGRIGGAGGHPAIGAGIVSPASVEVLGRPSAIISTSPDNHFTPSPHCGVTLSCRRRVIGARAYPSIRAGIVSSAGVQTNEEGTFSAPDDHFTAGPDRRVLESASGRVGGAGGCPAIVCACRITFGNSWKRVRVVCVGAACNSRFHRHTSQMFTASRAEASFVVRR